MPVADSYSAASGGAIHGGRNTPTTMTPLWAQSSTLLTPLTVPNSADFGGTTGLADYGGFQVIQSTGEIVAALNGGHAGTDDNRVVKFSLMNDSPAWSVLCQPTPVNQRLHDAAYNSDGLPAARHMYDSLCVVEQLGNRLVVAGGSGFAGNSITSGTTNSFDLGTNQWDAAGIWPNEPSGNTGHGYDPTRGIIWSNNGYRFNVLTKTWDKPISSLGSTVPVRFPMIHHTNLDIMFCLMWGTNWAGTGRTLRASKWNADGTGVQTPITFNASAAYSQFVADGNAARDINGNLATLCGSGMTYDHMNNCFWWYNGMAGTTGGVWSTTGNLYKIIPNSGSTWDMDIVTVSLPKTRSSGLNGNIKYIKKLKGIVLTPDAVNYGLYFIRTA